eukprot:1187027-Rhodomonas_salina.3
MKASSMTPLLPNSACMDRGRMSSRGQRSRTLSRGVRVRSTLSSPHTGEAGSIRGSSMDRTSATYNWRPKHPAASVRLKRLSSVHRLSLVSRSVVSRGRQSRVDRQSEAQPLCEPGSGVVQSNGHGTDSVSFAQENDALYFKFACLSPAKYTPSQHVCAASALAQGVPFANWAFAFWSSQCMVCGVDVTRMPLSCVQYCSVFTVKGRAVACTPMAHSSMDRDVACKECETQRGIAVIRGSGARMALLTRGASSLFIG